MYERPITPVATVATLSGGPGCPLMVRHAPAQGLSELVESGEVDAAIMASELGFSPLGQEETYLCRELHLDSQEFRGIAGWSHNDAMPTLVAAAAPTGTAAGGRLKGLVLAPGENSASYARFAMPRYGKHHRDFHYNMAYESLLLATTRFGARRIALSHLSASNRFDSTIATCMVEAAAHLRSEGGSQLEALVFFGCCIESKALAPIGRLAGAFGSTSHRPIEKEDEQRGNHFLLRLRWPEPAKLRMVDTEFNEPASRQ